MIDIETTNGVAIIRLNRPPVNALSRDFYTALGKVLAELEEAEDHNVAVLSSAVPTVFCAGADLNEFKGITPQQRRERHTFVSTIYGQLGNLSLPVVCAINGPAVGGGFGIACLCDFRFMADDAWVSMPEIARGTVGGGGAMLRRLGVRETVIRDIHFTGRRVHAPEALELGIADRVLPHDDLVAAAVEFAGEIAQHDGAAIRLTKKALNVAERSADWLAAYNSTHDLAAELVARSQTDHRQPPADRTAHSPA